MTNRSLPAAAAAAICRLEALCARADTDVEANLEKPFLERTNRDAIRTRRLEGEVDGAIKSRLPNTQTQRLKRESIKRKRLI